MKTNKNLILSVELKQKAEELAKKKGLTLNALIRLAISEYVERNK